MRFVSHNPQPVENSLEAEADEIGGTRDVSGRRR
jgi:hypothetical protein